MTQDPFYITLEKRVSIDPATAKKAMLKYMDYSMKEARAHGNLCLTKELTHGACLWLKPVKNALDQQIAKEKKQFLFAHLGRESLDTYCQIVDFMSEESRQVVSDKFWYLSILGISPDHQGKGLGLDLVLPVLRLTDKIGAASYLETFTPKNFGKFNNG